MFSAQRNKQWSHPPEALNGGVTYLVKFYGTCDVAVPKGMDCVKEATAKVKVEKQARKAAAGQRSSPKVELLISIAGLAIQDPKTKGIHYKFPLGCISYCADDKAEQKYLSFIAKDAERGTHVCYVMGNEKCAEEIILTIGQAFDLAYRKFLEKSDKEAEAQKQLLTLRRQVQSLQEENESLKLRIQQLEGQSLHLPSNGTEGSLGIPTPTASQVQLQQASRPEPAVGRRLENLLYELDEALYESVERKPQPNFEIYASPATVTAQAVQQQQIFKSDAAPTVPPRLTPGNLLDLEDIFGHGIKINTDELTIDSFDPLRSK